MSDYNPRDRGGGGSRFGGRDSGGRTGSWGRDNTRTMFKATCANCGRPCEVPFRPSGDRPIYCSDCFEKMGKKEGPGGRRDSGSFGRPRFEDRPYTPAGDGGKANTQITEQLKSLNLKLDKIVSLLESQVIKAPAEKIAPTEKIVPAPKKKTSEKKVAELSKLVSE